MPRLNLHIAVCVVFLCIVGCGGGIGESQPDSTGSAAPSPTQPKPAAPKTAAPGPITESPAIAKPAPTPIAPSMDQQQYGDFLTAARDWQEKTQNMVQAKKWESTAEPYRLKDVLNRNQPDKDVAKAQSRIISIAYNVNGNMRSCRIAAQLDRTLNDIDNYYARQREVKKEMSLFAEAVDSYSRKRFEEIPKVFSADTFVEYYKKYEKQVGVPAKH